MSNGNENPERMDTRSGEEVAIDELIAAIDLTGQYLDRTILPAVEGWSWFDALLKYAPDKAALFASDQARNGSNASQVCFRVTSEDTELGTIEILNLALGNLDPDARGRVVRWAASKFGDGS